MVTVATQVCEGHGWCLTYTLFSELVQRPQVFDIKTFTESQRGQSLPRGCSGPRAEVRGPDLNWGRAQMAGDRLTEALVSGLTPRQGPPSHGALLSLLSTSRTPGPSGGHSLHGWLWGALSAPMAFLVSPGRKSSSGVCGTRVNGVALS